MVFYVLIVCNGRDEKRLNVAAQCVVIRLEKSRREESDVEVWVINFRLSFKRRKEKEGEKKKEIKGINMITLQSLKKNRRERKVEGRKVS